MIKCLLYLSSYHPDPWLLNAVNPVNRWPVSWARSSPGSINYNVLATTSHQVYQSLDLRGRHRIFYFLSRKTNLLPVCTMLCNHSVSLTCRYHLEGRTISFYIAEQIFFWTYEIFFWTYASGDQQHHQWPGKIRLINFRFLPRLK